LALLWFNSAEMFTTPHIYEGGWANEGYSAFGLEPITAALIQSFHAWFWCLMVFSWASKILNKPSKRLAYLNEAVYPTYIVHMHLTFLPLRSSLSSAWDITPRWSSYSGGFRGRDGVL
jgi:hypothetical protein